MNGLIFMGLGAFVLVSFVVRFGLRWEALSGYVLGLAMIGLGYTRIRAGWPRNSAS